MQVLIDRLTRRVRHERLDKKPGGTGQQEQEGAAAEAGGAAKEDDDIAAQIGMGSVAAVGDGILPSNVHRVSAC